MTRVDLPDDYDGPRAVRLPSGRCAKVREADDGGRYLGVPERAAPAARAFAEVDEDATTRDGTLRVDAYDAPDDDDDTEPEAKVESADSEDKPPDEDLSGVPPEEWDLNPDYVAEKIDSEECPWCDDYDGDHVAQHASSAHPDEWAAYKDAS